MSEERCGHEYTPYTRLCGHLEKDHAGEAMTPRDRTLVERAAGVICKRHPVRCALSWAGRKTSEISVPCGFHIGIARKLLFAGLLGGAGKGIKLPRGKNQNSGDVDEQYVWGWNECLNRIEELNPQPGKGRTK